MKELFKHQYNLEKIQETLVDILSLNLWFKTEVTVLRKIKQIIIKIIIWDFSIRTDTKPIKWEY